MRESLSKKVGRIDTASLLRKVGDYNGFLTLEELDKRALQLSKTVNELKEPNPWFYLMSDRKRQWDTRTDAMKNFIISSHEFDRQATKAEVFDGILGSYFYQGGLLFGQVRRAALDSGLDQNEISMLDGKIKECSKIINSKTDWEVLPIKKLVQLQLAVLFETVNAISRN